MSITKFRGTGDHLRARELRALSDNLLDSVKEVTFSGDLTSRAYGKHARLITMQ
jgi:hypothetical protein